MGVATEYLQLLTYLLIYFYIATVRGGIGLSLANRNEIQTIICEQLPIWRGRDYFSAGLYVARFSNLSNLEIWPAWHAKEIERFEQFRMHKRRWSYQIGRYAAKRAILQKIGASAGEMSEIFIGEGVFGFPIVNHQRIHNIQVSISHSGEYAAAIAFSEQHPMGIDIEDFGEDFFALDKAKVIQSQLTLREREWMENVRIPMAEKAGLFWTAKEALSKVLRTGLMTEFSLYEINQIECSRSAWISQFEHFPQYKAMTIRFGESCVCSVVLPRKSVMQDILHKEAGNVEHYL